MHHASRIVENPDKLELHLCLLNGGASKLSRRGPGRILPGPMQLHLKRCRQLRRDGLTWSRGLSSTAGGATKRKLARLVAADASCG